MSRLFQPDPATLAKRFAVVALERGMDVSGYTYAVPDALADLAVGQRVFVPLGRGNRKVAGYVLEITAAPDLPPGKIDTIKEVLSRDKHGVSLPADLVELARWIAGYYVCPLGMVFSAILPAAVKRGIGTRDLTVVRAVPVIGDEPKLSKLQRAVLDEAKKAPSGGGGEWIEIKRLADRAGVRSVSAVKGLIDKGLLEMRRDSVVQAYWDPSHQRVESPGNLSLNPHQQAAVTRLIDAQPRGFGVFLLHGVTGSGKTEVYLRVIEALLQKGEGESPSPSRERAGVRVEAAKSLDRPSTQAPNIDASSAPHPAAPPPPSPRRGEGMPRGAIVLVPEIALTPQTVARFLGRFTRVAVLHSALSAAQRHEEWQRIRKGQVDIVIGARSAVFAPFPRGVGLIVVDEEHDGSYKADGAPRYHGRDVAIKRAQLAGCPVVLGSATPSLESYFNATEPAAGDGRSRYGLLRLPERVANFQLPRIDVVDMREDRRARAKAHERGVHLLSRRLELDLTKTFTSGGQAILLLNRRGYASYIACPDHHCGWVMNCHYCDAMMVYHLDKMSKQGGVLKCHHCEAEQILPERCPLSGHRTSVFGLGTQRVEEELIRKLPGVRLERMDRDSMRTSQDYYETLERFRRGELDLLVGTQMIAKGLDFPNVRLVGVVSADTALHLADFRAAERTFQLIAQVSGRAGRSEHPGTVVVQTYAPDDPTILLAAGHDYEGFVTREIATRRQSGLPPVTRLVRIVVRDEDAVAVVQRARTLADDLLRINRELGLNVRFRGPSPCPIARIAGYHRHHIELFSPLEAGAGGAAVLQRMLTAARNAKLLHADAATAIDVDPVALM